MEAMQKDVGADHEHDTEQYLTFTLENEEYGVSILEVQEIRGWESATKIPNTPKYV
ncbi:MAG: chemotaxis protein CheW, partial [Gammaproteobacteria bacterium]|nr:chemotaxis protein CheW [Gammaproteobacteria bacterium]